MTTCADCGEHHPDLNSAFTCDEACGEPRDKIVEWMRATRKAQGLPIFVTDPEALRRIASILTASRTHSRSGR